MGGCVVTVSIYSPREVGLGGIVMGLENSDLVILVHRVSK